MINITAYTDGSAVANGKNKGLGGFGLYIPDFFGEGDRGYGRGYANTKTGRMEIFGVLMAIAIVGKKLDGRNGHLTIVSDSQYVVNTIQYDWITKWRKQGWVNSSGLVKNKELWYKYLDLIKKFPNLNVTLQWQRGHQVDKVKGRGEEKKAKQAELLEDPDIYGNYKADKYAHYKQYFVDYGNWAVDAEGKGGIPDWINGLKTTWEVL